MLSVKNRVLSVSLSVPVTIVEMHGTRDNRNECVWWIVFCVCSRLTSGIVSPSELPDSPTQTVPPSPRHRKAPLEFPNITDTPPRPQQKSVFEDNVIKYKEVNTPAEFSTNTSLSSLTIDDEPSVPVLSILQVCTVYFLAALESKFRHS